MLKYLLQRHHNYLLVCDQQLLNQQNRKNDQRDILSYKREIICVYCIVGLNFFSSLFCYSYISRNPLQFLVEIHSTSNECRCNTKFIQRAQ